MLTVITISVIVNPAVNPPSPSCGATRGLFFDIAGEAGVKMIASPGSRAPTWCRYQIAGRSRHSLDAAPLSRRENRTEGMDATDGWGTEKNGKNTEYQLLTGFFGRSFRMPAKPVLAGKT